MKIASRFLPVLILGLLAVNGVAAKDAPAAKDRKGFLTIFEFVREQMEPLKTPVYFAECRTTFKDFAKKNVNDRRMIFFSPGRDEVRYAEFSWEPGEKMASASLANAGEFEAGPHVKMTGDILFGGWPELGEMQLMSEYLMRRGMTLLYPKDFSSIISTMPKTICPSWEEFSWTESDSLEKIYKKRGWNTALKFPSFPARH